MTSEVIRIAEAVRDAGGRALLVGGWVRDELLGLPPKDADLEVFGIPADRLRARTQAAHVAARYMRLPSRALELAEAHTTS